MEANFHAESAQIATLPVWVRFLVLQLEYYSSQWLLRVSSQIGKVLKFDEWTSRITRGSYARLCIEVDLEKPLKAGYGVNGKICKLQYEALHVICFHCGKYCHRSGTCPANNQNGDDTQGNSPPTIQSNLEMDPSLKEEERRLSFGSWMLARNPKRQPARQTSI